MRHTGLAADNIVERIEKNIDPVNARALRFLIFLYIFQVPFLL